jgi:hypothetical protein
MKYISEHENKSGSTKINLDESYQENNIKEDYSYEDAYNKHKSGNSKLATSNYI